MVYYVPSITLVESLYMNAIPNQACKESWRRVCGWHTAVVPDDNTDRCCEPTHVCITYTKLATHYTSFRGGLDPRSLQDHGAGIKPPAPGKDKGVGIA
jgi:hypothetical protein